MNERDSNCSCGRGNKEDDHFCSQCYLDMEAEEWQEVGSQ